MSDITLSAGIRQNLLSLQNTAQLMQTTQQRLATGKKVNSALDNPLNYFTSSSLNNRANQLSGLLDSMGTGIQTIQAANNGITAITNLVQQLQSTVSQARSDATQAVTPTTATAAANNSTATNNQMTFDIGGGIKVSLATATPNADAIASTLTSSGGTFGSDLSSASFTIDDGTGLGAQTITFQATSKDETSQISDINTSLAAAGSAVRARDNSGQIELVNSSGNTITVTADATAASDLGFTSGATSSDGSAATYTPTSLSDLATAINNNTTLQGKVSATYDATNGLTINNLQTSAITVTGYDGTNVTGSTSNSTSIGAATSGGLSSVRQNLLNQFSSLMGQIDKVAGDSGYNGINLLNGDTLTLNFNETNTSNISVHTQDSNGDAYAINATSLGITGTDASTSTFESNSSLDTLSTKLSGILTTLQTQASSLGSQLSVVQTRQSFTKSMVNTLQTGADNLVLADSNQEGANMLALQTRQSLSTTSLSLAAQSANAVLQLFQ